MLKDWFQTRLKMPGRLNLLLQLKYKGEKHSCQVYKRRDRDGVENIINVRQILRTTPTFGRPHPLSGDYVLPHPLNIEIYGLKFDNILSLCLCHTSICAIELDSGTMLQNQVSRDTTGTQGQIPGLSRPNRDTWQLWRRVQNGVEPI